MTPAPNVPIGVGQIAKVLGWTPKRARTWLDGLAARDASIIVRVGGRRMTTLASLRRVCPDVAKRFASDDDVSALRDELDEQADEIRRVARSLGEFRQKAHDWLTRLESRVTKIEGM